MRSAKIGISTTYGIPVMLTSPSSSSNARMGAVRRMNWNPSMMCSSGDTCRETLDGACTFIISSPIITAI